MENAAQFSTLRLPLSGVVIVGWMTLHPSTKTTSGFAECCQALAHRRFDAGCIQAALGEHFAGLGVLDVVVRQAQVQDRSQHAFGSEELGHRTAGTAHDAVLLDRHQQLVAARQFAQQGFVQRFDETHVDHRGVQRLADLQRLIEEDGITTVFSERLASPRLTRSLADDAGIVTAVIGAPVFVLLLIRSRRDA